MKVSLPIQFKTVESLLSDHASSWPDKTAIVDLHQAKSISFKGLARLVDTVALDLAARGVKKRDRVVLLADETMEKLVLWLSIWRLGAVVCPLNIEMIGRHIVELCDTCEPGLILIQDSLSTSEWVTDIAHKLVKFGVWSSGSTSFIEKTDGNLSLRQPLSAQPYSENDLSCIFCTSGTTDKPKLVVYDHWAHWLGGLSMIDALKLTPTDRTLEYRSFGWVSVQLLSFVPLLQLGLTLHIAPRFSKSRFVDWIADNAITVAVGVPTVIAILLESEFDGSATRMNSLRLMTCSTAPLSQHQWMEFERRYGLNLIQMYGMSEASWICANRPHNRRFGSVGQPVLNQIVKVVDQDGRPCKPNTEGEVTVEGDMIAVGYLRRDGATEAIRGKPLKTGDLAIVDNDGFVTISGRAKDLIIRGGVNISPAEIDEVLLSFPAVHEAAAVGVPDKIYGEEVVCFVVPKPSEVLNADEVLEHCKKHLPAAKSPKEVILADQLPRNDRGKVIRKTLRDEWFRKKEQAIVG